MEEGVRRSQFYELENDLERIVSSTRSNPADMGRELRSSQSPKKRKPNEDDDNSRNEFDTIDSSILDEIGPP
jgi:hypothetical protein